LILIGPTFIEINSVSNNTMREISANLTRIFTVKFY